MRYLNAFLHDIVKFLRGLEEMRAEFYSGRKTIDARDMGDWADTLAADCRRLAKIFDEECEKVEGDEDERWLEQLADIVDCLKDLEGELEWSSHALHGRTKDGAVRSVIESVGDALNRLQQALNAAEIRYEFADVP